jgi:endoglucanase
VAGGVQDVQGFFQNVSNYQFTSNSVEYGNWISSCIAYATAVNPGDFGGCPNQYWNGGPATNWNGTDMDRYQEWRNEPYSGNPVDLKWNTVGIDSRYDLILGSTEPTTHFVIDTSRNGVGPWPGISGHPASDGATQDWCNPPDRGLGLRPTANTGEPLVDAYLWVKIPGESDGQCYRWTNGPLDPVRGIQDPAAGQWFPDMALELVHNANPPLP